MLRPKEFKGKHLATEMDNFLKSIEQYFGAFRVYNNSSKVHTALMYLVGVVVVVSYVRGRKE